MIEVDPGFACLPILSGSKFSFAREFARTRSCVATHPQPRNSNGDELINEIDVEEREREKEGGGERGPQ